MTRGWFVKQLLLLTALASALLAQALEGTWQGTVMPPNQNDGIRLVFKIDKNGNTNQGTFYNLANGRQLNLGAITLQGNAVKIVIPGNGMTYEGKFEADGNSIAGTLNQGTNPVTLPLKRATVTTAWELPPPPAPPKPLPAGTKLEFEVASIKPSGAGPRFANGFSVTATEVRSQNISLANFITFTFELHRTQVSGLPGWAETEGYGILARLPQGGDPSDAQIRTMLQNLLRSRFGLAFHMEKRELSVYAIGIGKKGLAGMKMAPATGSGANIGSQGVARVSFRGLTMGALATQLQLRVLDRPVVDQTGLQGRYDATLNWRPDEFQFPDLSATQRAAAVANNDSLPDLFTAFQEQLGLKLEPAKASVPVLVIDSVSRSSAN